MFLFLPPPEFGGTGAAGAAGTVGSRSAGLAGLWAAGLASGPGILGGGEGSTETKEARRKEEV